jgi:serine/threonine protein kinase/WD40 repeat protein
MTLSAGSRFGPYEVLALLGAGGMGEVFRARDTRLDREVAIKALPEKFFEDRENRDRFVREAKLLAAVNHPNIAAIHSFEEISGQFLIVQELLEGESLRDKLHASLPFKTALEYAIQLAQGLAAAHEKGIVHRDLKPENLFVTRDGRIKILDFGVAKLTQPAPLSSSLTEAPTVLPATEPGVVIGTVAYMSPEQARGDPVDFRSDQFSLGTVLYEMLASKHPFRRSSAAETLAAVIRDEPQPLTVLDPKLPAVLGWVVQRCLSKDPEERYSSTKDLAKELQSLRLHLSEAVSAPDAKPVELPPPRRRASVWALVFASSAVAVAIGLFLGTRFLRPGSPSAAPVSLTLSFPADAAPSTYNTNPLALSPDGRTLVYAGRRGGGRQLFVRPLEREEVRPIPGTEGAGSPFFSPDGQWIGFFAEHKMKKVALSGGAPITLCEAPNNRGGTWGADGTIVFVPSPTGGLQRIPASGGEPKTVLAADVGKGLRSVYPQILPDGENVLFTTVAVGQPFQATVISLRTGKQRIVLEDATDLRYLPTGHLIFVRDGLLYAAPFNLQRLETSGSPVPLLEDLSTNRRGMNKAELAYSGEGTLVYVPYRSPQRTFSWVDRKGAEERTPFPPGAYHKVALSPDGGRLATLATGKAEEMSLLFGDFVRGTLTRSVAEGNFGALAWAPDGKRVAFGLTGDKQLRSVFWQGADDNATPELLHRAALVSEEPTSFSTDGNALLVQAFNFAPTGSAETRWETLVLPLTGEKKPLPFLQAKFSVVDAHFSPDGRWVAFASAETGRSEVYVQPYPGPGSRWKISTEGGGKPCWSRSGRELFYRDAEKVMAVDVQLKPTFAPGRPRLLFEGRYHNTNFEEPNSYDVSPDGTRFLMIKQDPEESAPAHVKVVLNWFEEVKRRVPGAK